MDTKIEELPSLEDIQGLMDINEIKRMLILTKQHQENIDKKLTNILSMEEKLEERLDYIEMIP